MKKIVMVFSVVLIAALMIGCKCASKAVVSKEGITTTGWELSLINGKNATASDYPNKLPNAVFTSDNKISGNGGCNSYGGSYTLDAEGNFTTSQLISTKMFCEGVKENDYLKALGRSNKAKMEGKSLVLYDENEAVLVFIPKKLE